MMAGVSHGRTRDEKRGSPAEKLVSAGVPEYRQRPLAARFRCRRAGKSLNAVVEGWHWYSIR
jgi:hypothetical protein